MVGLSRCAVTEAFDQPVGVVELDERGDGLPEFIDVAVDPGPQALLLEGLDPSLGAAVALGLAGVGRGVGDAEPGQVSADRGTLSTSELLQEEVLRRAAWQLEAEGASPSALGLGHWGWGPELLGPAAPA